MKSETKFAWVQTLLNGWWKAVILLTVLVAGCYTLEHYADHLISKVFVKTEAKPCIGNSTGPQGGGSHSSQNINENNGQVNQTNKE